MRLFGKLSKTEFKRHAFAFIFFALLTLIIFWGYTSGKYLVGTDAMGLPTELRMNSDDQSFFSTWRSFTSLGNLNYPSLFMASFYWLTIGEMGIQPLDMAKAIIVLSFFFSAVLMYVCVFRITASYLGAIVASLVYSFNQMFLAQVTEAHYTFLIGYAIFPLLFLLLYGVLKFRGTKSVLLLPLIAVVFGSVAAPNLVYIAAMFLILFGLLYIYLTQGSDWRKALTSLGMLAVAIMLIVLPIVLMKFTGGGEASLSVHYTIEDAESYSSYTIYHAFVLASSENTFIWGTSIGQWVDPSFLFPVGLIVAAIIPIVALYSLKYRKKEPLILAFVIPALIFVFLAKGPNPPLEGVFTWMFGNIPMLDSIRVFGRFLLLAGFAYAFLIALLIKNLPGLPNPPAPGDNSWKRVFSNFRRNKKQVLAALVVVGVLFPSCTLFTFQIRGFDLPASYAEPYEWLNGQQGDFRVLNLPFGHLYYKSDSSLNDGYPSTPTLDPGIYSPLISGKSFAYGLETEDFWSSLENAVEVRSLGYQNITELLGDAASVKYIVCQTQTDEYQAYLFSTLSGTNTTEVFSGGASILSNSDWAPRAHSIENLYLFTGGRQAMLNALGLDAVGGSSVGFIMSSQLNRSALLAALSSVDGIILDDSGLVDLAVQMTNWSSQEDLNIVQYGNSITTDTLTNWCVSNENYSSGYASGTTIDTHGDCTINIPIDASSSPNQDLLIKLIYGPQPGTLDIALDGKLISSLRPYAIQEHEGWVRIQGLNLSSAHTLTIKNDGSGWNSIEQVIIASDQKVEDALNTTTNALSNHSGKIIQMVSGASSTSWDPYSGYSYMGPKGLGISTELYLDAPSLASSSNLVRDANASSGWAISIEENASSNNIGGPIEEFEPGQAYNATFLLRSGEGVGQTKAILEVLDSATGDVIAQRELNGTDIGQNYTSFSLSFVAPATSVNGLQFKISNISGSVLLEDLMVKPRSQPVHSLNVNLPFAGDYEISVMKGPSIPNGTIENGNISVDGTIYSSVSPEQDEVQVFKVNGLTAGEHRIEVNYSSIYGIVVKPSDLSLGKSAPPSISYERISDTEYVVHISSNNDTWLLLSESYSPLWKAYLGNEELGGVPLDSIVNGYYIPSGENQTLTIKFQGQQIYDAISFETIAAMLFSTAVFGGFVIWRKVKGGRVRDDNDVIATVGNGK